MIYSVPACIQGRLSNWPGLGRVLLIAIMAWGVAPFAVGNDLAQADPKKKDPKAGDAKGDDAKDKKGGDAKDATEPKKRPSGFTEEEEKAILDLFHATEKKFGEDGRLRLKYEYRTEDENLLLDWKPEISKTKRRIRWAVRWDDGLMIAETGTFVHQAVWNDRFAMQVIGTSYAHMKDGAYRVAGIFDPKLSRVLGTNVGEQIVRLKGMRVTSGIPRKVPSTAVEQKLDFGFELKDGTFTSKRGKARLHDTSKKPKWTQKISTGRMGLRWNGRTQMCIHEITLEGKLDKKWVKKALSSKKT